MKKVLALSLLLVSSVCLGMEPAAEKRLQTANNEIRSVIGEVKEGVPSAMIQRLRTDFNSLKGSVSELEQLLKTPPQPVVTAQPVPVVTPQPTLQPTKVKVVSPTGEVKEITVSDVFGGKPKGKIFISGDAKTQLENTELLANLKLLGDEVNLDNIMQPPGGPYLIVVDFIAPASRPKHMDRPSIVFAHGPEMGRIISRFRGNILWCFIVKDQQNRYEGVAEAFPSGLSLNYPDKERKKIFHGYLDTNAIDEELIDFFQQALGLK